MNDRLRVIRLICVIASLVCFARTSHSAVWYVNGATGSGAHDGTSWPTAFQSIGQGLNAAAAGDEVWVAAGTYLEQISLKNGVGLYGGFSGTETVREPRGLAVNPTTIDATHVGTVVTVPGSISGATIDGFIIQHAGNNAGVAFAGNASVTISRNIIRLNGPAPYGGAISASGDCVIVDNKIDDNQGQYAGGIFITGVGSPVIVNNTIVGNTASNGAGGVLFDVLPTGQGSATFANNIVAFNSSGLNTGRSIIVDHNDFISNGTPAFTGIADPTGTNGNISVDPVFATSQGDVHLLSTSRCIDAGNAAYVTPGSTDIDDAPRIQGATVDIGAYEYDSPVALQFAVEPIRSFVGQPLAATPVVNVLDVSGHIVTGFKGPVTIGIKPGAGADGATLTGTLTVNAVAGTATFTDLSINRFAAGYVLSVSSPGLAGADSTPFTVSQIPVALVFNPQPAGARQRTVFDIQPVVLVVDASGQTVVDYNGPVTLAIKPGTGTVGATLAGTTTVPAINGVALFSGLQIDKPGTAYILTAAAGALSVDSQPFDVAQVAAQLVFTTQPAGGMAGRLLTIQPVLTVEDADGNPVPAYTTPVTVSRDPASGPAGAVLSGTLTVTPANGVATFADLAVDRQGIGYVLVGTSGSLSARSLPFATQGNSDVEVGLGVDNLTPTTGQNVVFTITVTNHGPDGVGTITVTDTLPNGLNFVSCDGGAIATCGGNLQNHTLLFPVLAAGSSATATITAAVDCSLEDGNSIDNTVTETSAGTDPNPANNTATITITTVNPSPVISCPANVSANTAPGQCSAVVTYATPVVTDNCPGTSIVTSPVSGSTFPKGDTRVSVTAMDVAGQIARCSFIVSVHDTEAPVITAPASVAGVYSAGLATAQVPLSATETDNCDASVSISGSRSDGKAMTDPFPDGSTAVTWTATDSSGNAGTAQTIVRVTPDATYPTVPAGYQARIAAQGGLLAGKHLSGMTTDPSTGDIYVAADSITARTGGAAGFDLVRIQAPGVQTLVGSYTMSHVYRVEMAWGPDGGIYTMDRNGGVYRIDPATGAQTTYCVNVGFLVTLYGLRFDAGGNLILMASNSPNLFYRVLPGTGSTFIGTYTRAAGDLDHGDHFGIRPDGDYVIYPDGGAAVYGIGDCTVAALSTANHTEGDNYTKRRLSGSDLNTLGVSYVNSIGALDPVTGDVYASGGNFGQGSSVITFTSANGTALTPSTVFISGIGNGITGPDAKNSAARGVTDLAFAGRSDELPGNSLFYLDDYTTRVYEARLAVAPHVAPVAVPDTATMSEDDSPITINVLANDSSLDNDGFSLVSVTQPQAGTVSISGSSVTYTPGVHVNGPDTFTYTIRDGHGVPATATVTVLVTGTNQPPVVNDDTESTSRNGILTIPAASLLVNDSAGPANEVNQTLTITAIGSPSHGGVAYFNGLFVYVPAADYVGQDAFTYTVTDNGTTNGAPDPRSATATVHITIISPTFTMADVSRAISITGGLVTASSADLTRLNVEGGPTSAIDMADVARLARKAAGLEPNP